MVRRVNMRALAAAATLAVCAQTPADAAATQGDFTLRTDIEGSGNGGNYCPSGPLSGCSLEGSAAILKIEFGEDGQFDPATDVEVNPLFKTIDGSEFSFSFGEGSTGTGTWTYTPDDAKDPGITGFAAKGGSLGANIYTKDSMAYAGVGDSAHFETMLNNGGQRAGLSNIVFFDSVSEVPVPAALPLFGTAVAGLAIWRRRRSA